MMVWRERLKKGGHMKKIVVLLVVVVLAMAPLVFAQEESAKQQEITLLEERLKSIQWENLYHQERLQQLHAAWQNISARINTLKTYQVDAIKGEVKEEDKPSAPIPEQIEKTEENDQQDQ